MDLADTFFAEAAPFQTNGIHTVSARFTRSNALGKGKHILGDDGAAADVSMSTHAVELMDRGKCAHGRPVLHRDVASQRCGVGHDHVITHRTVMADVSVSHNQSMAAQSGETAAFGRTAADGDIFANGVVVTNLKLRLLGAIR